METALDRLIGKQQLNQAAAQPTSVGAPQARVKRNPSVSLSRPASVDSRGNQDEGFDAGDVFKPLGKLAMGALRAIDAPRAAVVSATRELADAFDPNEDSSWSDFKDQFNRRAGAQELLFTGPHFSLDEKGWEDEILGFVTDVILDPLTYTPGVLAKQAIKIGGSIGNEVAQGALKVAVKDGSAKQISKTVARNAAQAGINDAPEIQKLITFAASRGRGALTEKGLREAGVSGAQRELIGLGAQRPGNARAVLQFAENVKGAAKQAVRESPIGFKTRKLFVPETMGRLSWLNDAFNKNLDFKRRAEAVLASSTINPAKAVANQWGALTMRRAELDMMGTRKARGVWASMSDADAVAATKNIELGVAGEAEDIVRKNFATMLDDLRNAGVEVNDFGPNYVPHYETQQFFDWAKKNPEDAKLVTSILNKQSFQKTRKLLPGEKFMGETLDEGSIDEINRIFREKTGQGFNMLEDDLRIIMPRYIKSAERSIGQAKQLELLGELGFSQPLATKLQKRTEPEFLAKVKEAKDSLKAAKQAQKDALKAGSKQRRGSLKELKDLTVARKKQLEVRLGKVNSELNDALRARNAVKKNVDAWEREIAAQRKVIARLERSAQTSTGKNLSATKRSLNVANKNLKQLEQQASKAKTEAETLLAGKTGKALTAAEKEAQPLLDKAARLEAEQAALRQQADELGIQAIEYKRLHDEAMRGVFDDEIRGQLLDANDTLEFWLKTLPAEAEKADLAETVYLFAQADATHAMNILKREIGELESLMQNELKGLPQVRAGKVAMRNDLRDKFNTVMTVLQRQDNSPAVQAIAKLEAVAAKADMDAWKAGNQVKLFERMLKDLDSQKMEKVLARADKGMTQIGEAYQMPDWLLDATKLEVVKNQLPFFGKWGQKYFNLFKGYAILRPGFHVRNLYSAMFNMYLEAGAGSMKNIRRWHQFYTKATHDPEGYMVWARQKFGEAEARLLDDAFQTISATGGGQAASEFSDRTFRKASKNPFDENNVALLKSRRAGGWVEDHVRGAHAYDVLKRGGTVDQAVDTISKWHFDYSDVTKFDQAMKLVNPFWIFFSRNLALQSQTWLGALPKINRTMVNFERNANFGLQDDEVVPEYFFTEGATPLGIKGVKGSSLYWFSDLPALTFPGELDRLSDPTDTKFLADLGPFLKIPFELAADRQLFSDIPIDTKKPAQLPFNIGSIPGLEALGGLPGLSTTGSGDLAMNPELMNVLRSAFPGLGQLERLAPVNDPKLLEKLPYTLASWLGGLTMVENSPRQQRGELYRRAYENAARREYEQNLAQM